MGNLHKTELDSLNIGDNGVTGAIYERALAVGPRSHSNAQTDLWSPFYVERYLALLGVGWGPASMR